MTEADLIHFVDAQAKVYGQVVEELTDGRKQNSLDVVRLSATGRFGA